MSYRDDWNEQKKELAGNGFDTSATFDEDFGPTLDRLIEAVEAYADTGSAETKEGLRDDLQKAVDKAEKYREYLSAAAQERYANGDETALAIAAERARGFLAGVGLKLNEVRGRIP